GNQTDTPSGLPRLPLRDLPGSREPAGHVPAVPEPAPMSGPLPPKLFLSQREAWQMLGVSRATWYRLRREGRVPEHCMAGGCPKWRRADLLSWAAGLPTVSYPWRRAVHA